MCLLSLASSVRGASLQRPKPEEVHEIDAKLVACGTRHSLSSWTRSEAGDRLRPRFHRGRVREIRGGRTGQARVVVDKFEATSPRTRDVPAPLENVYLVVEGSDPVLKSTAFFVSGHYDSMCSDIMDSACDAPGADDDASGTTVAIVGRAAPRRPKALARRSSSRRWPAKSRGCSAASASLVWAKEQGLTVGGVLNNDIVGATNGSKDMRPRVFSDDDAASPARHLGLWLEEFMGDEGRPSDLPQGPLLTRRRPPPVRRGRVPPPCGSPSPGKTTATSTRRRAIEDGVEYGDLQKFMDFKFLAEVARINAEAALAARQRPGAAVLGDLGGRGQAGHHGDVRSRGRPGADADSRS